MKIKPAHILAGFFWLNFILCIWATLLGWVDRDVVSASMTVILFLLAIATSTIADSN